LAVAAERSPDRFRTSPVLKCDRKHDGALAIISADFLRRLSALNLPGDGLTTVLSI
jgi:hypothetical protein